jgi:DMSO/TMAO reductase YedYZ molybdopterin-dependent catalytic subunit
MELHRRMDRNASETGARRRRTESGCPLCGVSLRRQHGPRGSDATQFYYESLDLLEATHPQTLLAYELNGQALSIEHGAPVRLRAEQQLGYKMAKFVNRIELVDSFSHVNGGRGGYWENQGYSWYGGI